MSTPENLPPTTDAPATQTTEPAAVETPPAVAPEPVAAEPTAPSVYRCDQCGRESDRPEVCSGGLVDPDAAAPTKHEPVEMEPYTPPAEEPAA